LFVIGTAGHVDHGKSTLVEALTGINPDRLIEEQEREMTIDLGFAWLTLPSGREVSIVDVPGHERFVKNMLAGVGGIDAALLVVAADEGIMPQTQEHLDILTLLQVPRGVVAITKTDLAPDPEWLDMVQEEVREHLRGTPLENAPLVSVSARARQGLEELLAALDRTLAEATPRLDRGRPRLPIDRIFTMPGFGTVVTGTLQDGSLHVGQEVEIMPGGLRGRIRGLQTHKKKVEEAPPGRRTAVNVSGLAVEELVRGDVLTTPGWLLPTRRLAVRLRLLPSVDHPLRQDDILALFLGSAERRARATLLEVEELAPGATGWVLLRLDEPLVAVRGDRFIVRRPSPGTTVGGGVVVDPQPGRLRRFRREAIAALEALERGRPEDVLLRAFQDQPRPVRTVIKESGLPAEEAAGTLRQLWQDGTLVALQPGENDLLPTTLLLPRAEAVRLHERIRSLLGEHHARYPLRSGMPKEELKSQLRLEGRVFNDVLAWAEGNSSLVVQGALVRQPGHRLRYSPEQQAQVDHLLRLLRRQPYAPPARAEWGIDEEVLDALVEEGRVVRLNPEVVFLPETYQDMVRTVLEQIARSGPLTVAQVRDLFQTSRKYALALLEDMDQQKLTRRVGDERVRY
jgi:selenocysteine-specific elongation factor